MPADRGGAVAAGPSIRPPAPAPPRVVANPDNQVQTPRPQGAPPSHTDITSSGPGYGSARANAYKATPSYRQAIAHVFSIQPTAQKAAIISGLVHQNAFKTPEYTAVFGAVKNMFSGSTGSGGTSQLQKIANLVPNEFKSFITANHFHVGDAVIPGDAGLTSAIGDIGHFLLRPLESDKNGPPASGMIGSMTPFAKGTLGSKMLVNTAKDAWNLPSNTVEGLYGIGDQVFQGHFGTAAHMFIDPYVSTIGHVLHGNFSDIVNHPLNTYLMFAGGKAVAGRGAGAVARSGALGEGAAKAASTVREPLNIGTVAGQPSPIVEARNYSPDVLNKAFQVSREKILRRRGQNPNVSRPAPSALPDSVAYAMNVGTRAKLYRGVDEMTAVHQIEQRAVRAIVGKDMGSIRPSAAARNVVSHVLQGVIRTPHTAVEDAVKEINRLKAAQTGVRSTGEIWNRNQVRDLTTALHTPGALEEALRTAEKLRPQLHTQDAYLVTHSLLDAEQAAKSRLFPYAQAHMGARYDHVNDRLVGPPKFDTRTGQPLDPTLRAELGRLRGREENVASLLRRPGSAGEKVAAQRGLRATQERIRSIHEPPAPLTTEAILEHLKKNGVPDPAYVGHFPGKVSPFRFYSAYKLARGTLGKGKRTGEAFRAGAYDHTWNGLAGQMVSRAQAVSKASLHDRVISRYGITLPEEIRKRFGIPAGEDLTPAEARAIARAALVDDHGNAVPNALELTPISRGPADLLGQVRDLQNPHELGQVSQIELQALAHAVEDAAKRTDGTRNVALVPRDVTQRFAQQYARTDGLMRHVGRVTQQFRRTVLPYSTHWMTQIGSEAALRALIGGALDPRYLSAGRRLAGVLEDTPEGRAANAEMTNATFYSGGGSGVREALRGRAGRGGLDIHNPNPGVVSSAAHAFPPSRLLIAAHNRYADTITAAMYSLEHNARLMGLGKLAHKEIQSFGFSWRNAVHMQGDALSHLADRLKSEPALVAKFGRAIDNTFGKYNKFTPMQRAMVQSFMPFLPWYLNAAKYVLWHLPAHHPVATALLASLRQTVNQDLADGKKAPLNAYAMQELARISPFGIFTPPSTTPSTGAALAGQHFLDAMLPEAQGSLYNLAGLNSFGAGPLKGPGGTIKAKSGPAASAAAENLLEAFLPLARYARLAEEGGAPAYGTSTILNPQPKPGGKVGASAVLKRVFDPFYSFERAGQAGPAYGAPPGASSKQGGWWSGGGSSGGSGSSGGGAGWWSK